MRLAGHIVSSLGAGTIVYLIWHSFTGMAAAVLGGIFIDLDHLFDYAMRYGFNPAKFSFKKFCDMAKTLDSQKVYFILHSLELLIIFWLAIFIFKWGIFWLGLAIGVTMHIFFDQFINRTHPFTYFLTFRIIKGFKTEDILRI